MSPKVKGQGHNDQFSSAGVGKIHISTTNDPEG
jgi:hypothetical protein